MTFFIVNSNISFTFELVLIKYLSIMKTALYFSFKVDNFTPFIYSRFVPCDSSLNIAPINNTNEAILSGYIYQCNKLLLINSLPEFTLVFTNLN